MSMSDLANNIKTILSSEGVKNADHIIKRIVTEALPEFQKTKTSQLSVHTCNVKDQIRASLFSMAASKADRPTPEGVRFHYNAGSLDVVCIEQKPTTRIVLIDESWHTPYYGAQPRGFREETRGPVIRRNLALPYVVMVVRYNNYARGDVFMGFRNEPVSSIDDTVFFPMLGNVASGLGVCMGGKGDKTPPATLAEATRRTVREFWERTFNYNLNDALQSSYFSTDKRVQTYSDWEKESKIDPMFATTVSWMPQATIRNMMGGLMNSVSIPNIDTVLDNFVKDRVAIFGK